MILKLMQCLDTGVNVSLCDRNLNEILLQTLKKYMFARMRAVYCIFLNCDKMAEKKRREMLES